MYNYSIAFNYINGMYLVYSGKGMMYIALLNRVERLVTGNNP